MAKQLGYACINMTLAKQGISCNRSMIRRTFDSKGVAYASELILENLRNLTKIVSWNNQHGIKVYRMSSNMFPWMSEYEFTDLPDYDKICNLLKGIGKLAMDNGQRLSFHPGQFCVLASPNEEVVLNAMNELDKSAQIMDLMGLPESRMAKINIHVGGAYGDKKAALDRFCKNFLRLQPSAQARLTVENDDKANMYSVKDLYDGVYKVVGIPIVFDYFHHKFCTGDMTEEEALKLAASTWGDVKPCTHYSESRRDEQKLIIEGICKNNNITIEQMQDWPTLAGMYKEFSKIKVQAHSDYIKDEIKDYGLDIDVVVEAKAKELAFMNEKYKKVLTEVLPC
jgi:UV DNA damage endonuclease|tara:strand:- start:1185 stop:2201 length:1017 start_codon:yes stop_codon:yes gene_type:complete